MNHEQSGLTFLDFITIYSLMLQIESVDALRKDASNNDLMGELQAQDREYLSRILEAQKEILERLERLENLPRNG